MKHFRLSLAFLFIPVFAYNQEVNLQYAREQYFAMTEENCNSLHLKERFDKNPPKDGLLKAYYGASAAAAPACIGNPAGKLASFKKGKSLIDDAIGSNASNYEIRFLRFATQDKAPGFLGYNDNLQEDKNFLISNIGTASNNFGNSFVFKQILNFLIKSDELNQKEKIIVNEYLNSIEN